MDEMLWDAFTSAWALSGTGAGLPRQNSTTSSTPDAQQTSVSSAVESGGAAPAPAPDVQDGPLTSAAQPKSSRRRPKIAPHETGMTSMQRFRNREKNQMATLEAQVGWMAWWWPRCAAWHARGEG